MPRLRKPEPVALNDDELYALMRVTVGYLPKVRRFKPSGYELELLKDAYHKIAKEYYARAEEQQRIDEELRRIEEEYIEPKYD
jgi:hypothetical protein